MKVLILIPLLFLGCTKKQIGCALEDAAVAVVSPVVATTLQCTNQAAISADLKALADKANICTQVKAGNAQFAPTLCAVVVGIAVDQASKAIPPAWGCSSNLAGEALRGLLSAACAAVPH